MRAGGIEPPTPPWQGGILPLNHARIVFTVAHSLDYSILENYPLPYPQLQKNCIVRGGPSLVPEILCRFILCVLLQFTFLIK